MTIPDFSWTSSLWAPQGPSGEGRTMGFLVCVCVVSHSITSNSLWPHGLQPARLLCPWRFSRQEYWGGLPFPPPGNLPNPGIKPVSCAAPHWQVSSLPLSCPGSPRFLGTGVLIMKSFIVTQFFCLFNHNNVCWPWYTAAVTFYVPSKLWEIFNRVIMFNRVTALFFFFFKKGWWKRLKFYVCSVASNFWSLGSEQCPQTA